MCDAHALAPDELCWRCERTYSGIRRRRLWLCFAVLMLSPLAIMALVDQITGLGLLASYGALWRRTAEYAHWLHGYGVSHLCGIMVWSAIAWLFWAVIARAAVDRIERIWRRAFFAERVGVGSATGPQP